MKEFFNQRLRLCLLMALGLMGFVTQGSGQCVQHPAIPGPACSQNVSSGNVTVAGGQVVCYNGSGNFGTADFQSPGTLIIAAGQQVSGGINANNGGTLIVLGEFTWNGAANLNGTFNVYVGPNGRLNKGGDLTIYNSNALLVNEGTLDVGNNITFTGDFYNSGTIEASGINVNGSSASFSNTGLVTVSGFMNVNGGTSAENCGTLDVGVNLEINGGATFVNHCNLIVHDFTQQLSTFHNHGVFVSGLSGGGDGFLHQGQTYLYDGSTIVTKDFFWSSNGSIHVTGTASIIVATSTRGSQGQVTGLAAPGRLRMASGASLTGGGTLHVADADPISNGDNPTAPNVTFPAGLTAMVALNQGSNVIFRNVNFTGDIPAPCNSGSNPCANVSFNFSDQTTPTSFQGACDGQIDLTVSGGTAPYTYAWSNGGTTEDLSLLCAGVYIVTVTDANGCTGNYTVLVGTNTNPCAGVSFTFTSQVTSASSPTACDGQIDLSVSGGTAPYTYAWSNGGTTEDLSQLCAGVYIVTLTDANGCNEAYTVQVGANVDPCAGVTINFSDESGPASSAVACDGSIDLTVGGGTEPYSFQWSNGETSEDIGQLCAGTYIVTVTDANGCTGTHTVVVSALNTDPCQGVVVAVAVVAHDVDCYGSATGSASANASGGHAPYAYLWSNGQTGPSATNLGAGTYAVMATDSAGCVGTANVTITTPAPIDLVDVILTSPTSHVANDGALEAVVTGGTPPYNYFWSTGAATPVVTGVGVGSYGLTVMDANGCLTMATIELDVDPGPCDDPGRDTCMLEPGEFRTQTQGGWGANCNGNNSGCYLNANFDDAFPYGLTIGCNRTLTLSSASAVNAYLPCGGNANALTANYTDPACLNNVLSGQLIAATLSVNFDYYDPNFGASNFNLADLVVANGAMAGMTVAEVILEANNAIGGCGSSFTLSQINQTLSAINQNFVDGNTVGSALLCPEPCGNGLPPRDRARNANAWPNPSKGEVNVAFELLSTDVVMVRIFDLTGRQAVRTYAMGELSAGEHIITWDGTDNSGRRVTAGIYLVEMVGENHLYTAKVIRE